MAKFWLFKTEPGTYSFDTLVKEKKTNWDHVRNFQARNVLRTCSKGEHALIYHSGDEKSVVGIAEITKEAYPDLDPKKAGDWVQIDLKFFMKIETPVSLAEMKKNVLLKNLQLIKQSRLSCMEVSAKEFETILKMGDSWTAFQKLK